MKDITNLNIDDKSTGIEVGDYQIKQGKKFTVIYFLESVDEVVKVPVFEAEILKET